MGILPGQDVLTVGNMQAKLQAQLRGLGCGFLPEPMVRAHVQAGQLVLRQVARPVRDVSLCYAWRETKSAAHGRALQWWLQPLGSSATRRALLENHSPSDAAPALTDPGARVESPHPPSQGLS